METYYKIFVLSLFFSVQRTLYHCERSVAISRKGYLIKITPDLSGGFCVVFYAVFACLMLELGVIKVVIKPVFFDKFVVSAFFDDVAFVHYKDKVGVFDC